MQTTPHHTLRRARSMRDLARRATLVVCAAALSALSACSSASDLGSADVAGVQLSESALSLRVGGNAALVAHVMDDGGKEVTGKRVFWSSRDPNIATVTESGVVSAVAPGATEVSASVEGRSAVAAVTVLPRGIAALQLDPTSVQLVVGTSRKITARAVDDGGGVVNATPQWSSSDARVATVSGDGTIAAVAAGVATVTASLDGRSASVAVVVTPVPVTSVSVTPPSVTMRIGESVQLSATPRDANGQTVPGRTVQWSTPDATIVSVSTSGQVIGLKEGSATVNAQVDGVRTPVPITVQNKKVSSIDVSPSSTDLGVGGTVRLAATPRDLSGEALPDRTVSFSSDAPAIASVATDGTVSGVAPGQTTIRASSDGVTGTASVRVVPPAPATVASVTVTPGTATVQIGQTVTLTATARASNGTVITGRTVTWTTGDATRATVAPNGATTAVVTAVAPGMVQIVARVDGVSSTAIITVPLPAVASVEVTPASSSIPVGGTVDLTATVKGANGQTLTGRTVTWSSSDAAVATVSSNGRVTGEKAGTATIRATSEGVIGSASVTVTQPVPTLRLAPETATMKVGDRIDLRLFARFGSAPETEIIGGTTGVSWTSSNQQIAQVNGNGRVTAQKKGVATITVTYLGGSAASTITVND